MTAQAYAYIAAELLTRSRRNLTIPSIEPKRGRDIPPRIDFFLKQLADWVVTEHMNAKETKSKTGILRDK
ncbi:MAG: hypothetical protein A2X59_04380 [Nitrospirae bacterium GWC2_42_7]|nr:MAG: hypothetical protein A2X59_04380 [Nitrospirae bacterium GWC2_42_7]